LPARRHPARLDQVGGEWYLVMVARTHPPVFCRLLEKALPLQLTGAAGAPKPDNLPNLVAAKSSSYVPANSPALGDLFGMFRRD
jgi:hypothetical protein